MIFDNAELSVEEFLSGYWQRKPLLLRQAFPDFSPELDVDDIAGLACEELVESRLVTGRHDRRNWTLRHGPFPEQELTTLPVEDWTLLVQDVEKHYPPLQQLFSAFSFLPRWRLDDLMVSVAAPGGSVGPHVDQYDVFLLQASGRRMWSIAESFDPALLEDCDLNVLAEFRPEREWTLAPGDMLYLPPGVAHHGVAIDTGMTWSFGLRAPSSADLLQAWGEWLAEHRDEGERYRDALLKPNPAAGEVEADAVRSIASLMTRTISGERDFRQFLGGFLSRYRLAHEPAAPEEPIGEAGLAAALAAGSSLCANPWTRLLWIRHGNDAMLFAAGDAIECSLQVAVALCRNPVTLPERWSGNDELIRIATLLVNRGHLYLAP